MKPIFERKSRSFPENKAYLSGCICIPPKDTRPFGRSAIGGWAVREKEKANSATSTKLTFCGAPEVETQKSSCGAFLLPRSLPKNTSPLGRSAIGGWAVKEKEKVNSATSTKLTFCGAPEGTRTPDLLIRSQTLYPAELRAHRQLT